VKTVREKIWGLRSEAAAGPDKLLRELVNELSPSTGDYIPEVNG
jgi:hypothetical protein